MILKKLVVGSLWTNCYILASQVGGEAAVIDPGDEAETIIDALNKDNLKLKYIINTHGHFDHIGANDDLKKATGAKVALHPKEGSHPDVFLEEGQLLELEDIKIKVMETPGHSGGGISLLVGNRIFSGDLLFNGSVGRTDLPGGSVDALRNSLRKLLRLPDNIIIYPGHGPQTTLKKEKESNPYFEGL